MTELNIDRARYNMVEQQVRPWDVLDQRVLDVMSQTPRERFVPEKYRNLAFADVEIPIGHGQTMMSPKLEGRLLQALSIQPTDSILEIGTGTGYLTACLAELGKHVVTVEILAELSQSAQMRLAALGITNVGYRVGDACQGWSADGYFDVIAITGSVPLLDDSFKHQLNVGGRMFVVVGELPVMEALLITRATEDEWTSESLFETLLPPLQNASRPQPFTF